MTGQEAHSSPEPHPVAVPVRRGTLILTNLTKIAGLAIFLNEAVIRSDARLPVLGICLFCIAGAQASETTILAFIDKFLGR